MGCFRFSDLGLALYKQIKNHYSAKKQVNDLLQQQINCHYLASEYGGYTLSLPPQILPVAGFSPTCRGVQWDKSIFNHPRHFGRGKNR